MKETFRTIISALIGVGAFLVLTFVADFNFFVGAGIGVGLYFGFYLLLKPTRKLKGIDVESVPGGEELTRLLDEAEADLRDVEKSAKAIKDPSVREDAEKLGNTGRRIMNYLKDNPDKIRLARRFFTYYLDTAGKLLTRYVEFQDTGLQTGEVSDILTKTAQSLPVLNEAFEKQFTNLMQGELLDVESDIALLENTLKMEDGK